MKVKC